MQYTNRLPSEKDMIWLSKLTTSYPVTRREILRIARMWNFKPEVVSFLRLFAPDQLFETRTDFVARCESLALLIRQEWEAPKETIQSPQD